VLELLEQGEANRHVGSTRMNEGSSRSHTVFRMVIESRARASDAVPAEAAPEDGGAGAILVSTLTLVDLAGSERVAKTGAEGIRMKEGTAINRSLLTLGTVINKLSEGAHLTGEHGLL
jgi:centromeric protein E